jgi:hypothetical protein
MRLLARGLSSPGTALPSDMASLGVLWLEGAVSTADSAFLRDLAAGASQCVGQLREGYRAALRLRCLAIGVIRYPRGLESPVIHRLPLPHLGLETEGVLRMFDDSLSWEFPEKGTTPIPWGASILPGDDWTGAIPAVISEVPLPLDPMARTATLAAQAANVALSLTHSGDAMRQRAFARALRTQLADESSCWRAVLARVASTVSDGDDVSEADRDIVARTVLARAEIERWEPDIQVFDEAWALDESLSRFERATLALDEHQTAGLLSGIAPEPGAWWSLRLEPERILSGDRLDGLLAAEREQGLTELFAAVRSRTPSAIDKVLQRGIGWFRNVFGDLAFPVPLTAYARAAGVGEEIEARIIRLGRLSPIEASAELLIYPDRVELLVSFDDGDAEPAIRLGEQLAAPVEDMPGLWIVSLPREPGDVSLHVSWAGQTFDHVLAMGGA